VLTEADLLAQARTLDSRALGQIHDQYYPEIYRFVLYRTDDSEAAQDLASEVFVRLLTALHQKRPPQTTLRGWLFGVAAHLVADHFRRKPTLPLDEELIAGSSTSAEAEAHLQKQAVRQAMQTLTSEQQDVLALRFGDGFSVEQTAEALGKSVTATKALQFRATEALRRALAGHAL
jgi:RNA polymerase sigma-70 factor (ECF subfamily)